MLCQAPPQPTPSQGHVPWNQLPWLEHNVKAAHMLARRLQSEHQGAARPLRNLHTSAFSANRVLNAYPATSWH